MDDATVGQIMTKEGTFNVAIFYGSFLIVNMSPNMPRLKCFQNFKFTKNIKIKKKRLNFNQDRYRTGFITVADYLKLLLLVIELKY
jgi:hypothetical protein